MSVSHRVISVSSAALLFAGIGVAHSSGPTPKRPAQSDPAQRQPDIDWPAYNGNINGQHYSALSLINRSNVSELKVAWQYDTGEKGNLETNPLIVGRVLFGYTYSGKVIALDGATGALLWTFDSGAKNSQPSRGFAWLDRRQEAPPLRGRAELPLRLDPATGKPIPGFGEDGRIDLRKDLRGDYKQQSIALTTPGIIYKNLIIVGGRNPETASRSSRRHPRLRCPHRQRCAGPSTPSRIPASSATTPGRPTPGKTAGAANNWAGMSLDAERGIVYRPDRLGSLRFLRRRSHRQRPLRRHAACPRCRDRQASLAFPGRPSRHLGPRFPAPPALRHRRTRRQAHRRRGADHQAGRRLPLRSRHRRAALPDRGTCLSAPATCPAKKLRPPSPCP